MLLSVYMMYTRTTRNNEIHNSSKVFLELHTADRVAGQESIEIIFILFLLRLVNDG